MSAAVSASTTAATASSTRSERRSGPTVRSTRGTSRARLSQPSTTSTAKPATLASSSRPYEVDVSPSRVRTCCQPETVPLAATTTAAPSARAEKRVARPTRVARPSSGSTANRATSPPIHTDTAPRCTTSETTATPRSGAVHA